MDAKRLLLLIAISTFTTACSQIPMLISSDSRIDYWEKQGNWLRAKQELLKLPDSEEKAYRLKFLDSKIQEAYQQLEVDVQEHQQEQSWHAAGVLLGQAWEHLDNETSRVTVKDKRSAKQLNQLQIEELLQRSLWIDKQLELENFLQKKHKTQDSPQDTVRKDRRIANLKKEQTRLLDKVLAMGQKALSYNNIDSAKRCFIYLDNRSLTKVQGQKLAKLNKTLQGIDIRTQQKQEEGIISLLDLAIEEGDYQTARKLADKLGKEKNLDSATRERLNQLDAFFTEQAYLLDKQAEEFYTQQMIVEATTFWELALQLDRDNNEVAEKLNRAKKVLKQLDKLRGEEVDNNTQESL